MGRCLKVNKLESEVIPWKYCIVLLALGVILVINFFFATRFQLQAMEIEILVTKAKSGAIILDNIENLEGLAKSYESKGKILAGVAITTTISVLFAFIFDAFRKMKEKESFIKEPIFFNLLEVSKFVFPSKTQKDTFEPIVADWQEEYFEALHKKEIWKARWIDVRYTYAFLLAMWQKSPIGDLIEYISKLAK